MIRKANAGVTKSSRSYENPKPSGTRFATSPAMTDDLYVTLLLWTICVLTFACSVVAITEHPEWFGA
jgi:hypothetical protein